ncbi:MAG: epoxyqueuosine reductase QueH [Campylobacterota bacterium]|nr:epoxyqueuosine reductase QueH [Campylobacterota bacterium]
MLVHICCSVDSHYFLQRLQKEYPDEKLVGFFYDPNIHPYSEYRLRYEDVKYSCDILGIELLEGEYNLQRWMELTKGMEDEPEKGDRCTVCFEHRLEVSVKKAIQLDHDKFTTTLLISPKKSQDKLETIGKQLSKKYHCEFIFKDYRSGKGVELQGKEVKNNNLYRQNYCGCLYALNAQRDIQNKLADELMLPIGKQILPESIEERLALYKKRDNCSQIIKQRFLNYRLLSAKVIKEKVVIPSYFLPYSTLKNNKSQGRVEKIIDDIYYFNRDEIKLISLDYFNDFFNTNYKNVLDLVYDPLLFEDDLKLRAKITHNSHYDLSCIIVLDKLDDKKLTINCNSKVYDDVRECSIEL